MDDAFVDKTVARTFVCGTMLSAQHAGFVDGQACQAFTDRAGQTFGLESGHFSDAHAENPFGCRVDD